MKRILILSFLLWHTAAAAQTISDVLRQIEAHNPSLSISMSESEVQKLENRSEALLTDPEVEFNYLWGHEAQTGNRYDVRVTQSFDIPTLTGMRVRQANDRNTQATLKYKADRLNVLLEAKQLCIELVFYNQMAKELTSHLNDAKSLTAATERKMQMGESSVLELNKAKLHLTSVRGKLSRINVERDALLSRLRTMNDGQEISFDSCEYDSEDLPADFNAWYNQAAELNPVLAYVRNQAVIDMNQVRIDKTSWLPNLTVGYMSEIGLNDKYRGVTLGLAIPLWRNTNKVRQSMARVDIAQRQQKKAEQEFYDKLIREYNQARGLKDIALGYREALESNDNRAYLLAAQSQGEISMIDYLYETDLYYDSLEEALAAERDYRKSLADLNSVNL